MAPLQSASGDVARYRATAVSELAKSAPAWGTETEAAASGAETRAVVSEAKTRAAASRAEMRAASICGRELQLWDP